MCSLYLEKNCFLQREIEWGCYKMELISWVFRSWSETPWVGGWCERSLSTAGSCWLTWGLYGFWAFRRIIGETSEGSGCGTNNKHWWADSVRKQERGERRQRMATPVCSGIGSWELFGRVLETLGKWSKPKSDRFWVHTGGFWDIKKGWGSEVNEDLRVAGMGI